MLTGDKLRFKSRKGQWRKRVITHIEEMVRRISQSPSADEYPTDVEQLELAAKLTRMGVLGEIHLKDSIALDFSRQMRHDILMMLLVIAAFSAVWRARATSGATQYIPTEDLNIWEAKHHYADWTIATRRTWQHLMSTIEKIS